MAHGKDDILKFYEEFPGDPEYITALRVFIPRLFHERAMTGCTFFTSLATLCIVRYPTYAEWLDKPVLFVNCPAKDRIRIEFQLTLASLPVYRTITDSVNCPVEVALEEFDKLYAKFMDAHADDPHGPDRF